MSIFDFFRKFGTEEACFEYLVRIRWPKGYFCPVCGSTRASFRHNRRFTRSKDPMKVFNELLGIGTFVDAPEYHELYRSGEPGGWIHPNPPKKRRS